MTFLAPLFLAGLLGVAIPIVVHLTHRPRREAYAFPSLMFLARIPFRSVKRQRVRHWWLLALRIGVVALIVSAFARPLLNRLGAGGGAFAVGREVVVLLDDSYSMRYGDRWQRAVAAAGHAVDGLGPSDRATIVLFDTRARALGQARRRIGERAFEQFDRMRPAYLEFAHMAQVENAGGRANRKMLHDDAAVTDRHLEATVQFLKFIPLCEDTGERSQAPIYASKAFRQAH